MTITDLNLTRRESLLMDYAQERRTALQFRAQAWAQKATGHDNSLAVKFAREYAASARQIWRRITQP